MAVWRRYSSWLEVRVLVWISMGFVILESVVGAIAVLLPSVSPAILAVTLGVSLISFAGNILVTIVLAQIQRQHPFGSGDPHRLRANELPKNFTKWTLFTLGYTFIAMYVGAYLAKSNISDSFRGYPFPSETYHQAGFKVYFDILHRGIAIGLFLLIIRLFISAYRWRSERPDLYRGALLAILLVAGQILSGAYLILTNLSLLGFLIHVSVVSCLFATLAYLFLQSLPEPLRPNPSSISRIPSKSPSRI
ncbi:hypothetical protein B2M26_13275 [Ferroacidibacillus organovorans]|uniref:Heme A synthase n=1 Tax=Ferroacidibacillus organovorans TaxID=1765683 RepID=A0A1V4EQB3_9BACL|nr:hypothetical protein B2M26_13275 [Ferroacidibacillus organovorans]